MAGPMALALAPAALSGVANFFGQRSANRANRQEAQKNRNFQERMRNTEWQAGVADMEKAGINPALAYSQGGASAPSGAVAASQESATREGVSSALAVRMQQEQFKLMKAQTDSATAQMLKTQSEQQGVEFENRFKAFRLGFFSKDGQPNEKFRSLMEGEVAASIGGGARALSQARVSQFSETEMRALSEMWGNIGSGGAGMKTFLNLVTSIISRR